MYNFSERQHRIRSPAALLISLCSQLPVRRTRVSSTLPLEPSRSRLSALLLYLKPPNSPMRLSMGPDTTRPHPPVRIHYQPPIQHERQGRQCSDRPTIHQTNQSNPNFPLLVVVFPVGRFFFAGARVHFQRCVDRYREKVPWIMYLGKGRSGFLISSLPGFRSDG